MHSPCMGYGMVYFGKLLHYLKPQSWSYKIFNDFKDPISNLSSIKTNNSAYTWQNAYIMRKDILISSYETIYYNC